MTSICVVLVGEYVFLVNFDCPCAFLSLYDIDSLHTRKIWWKCWSPVSWKEWITWHTSRGYDITPGRVVDVKIFTARSYNQTPRPGDFCLFHMTSKAVLCGVGRFRDPLVDPDFHSTEKYRVYSGTFASWTCPLALQCFLFDPMPEMKSLFPDKSKGLCRYATICSNVKGPAQVAERFHDCILTSLANEYPNLFSLLDSSRQFLYSSLGSMESNLFLPTAEEIDHRIKKEKSLLQSSHFRLLFLWWFWSPRPRFFHFWFDTEDFVHFFTC